MRRILILTTLAWLAGCATPVALTAPEGASNTGRLSLTWLEPHAMEVQLQGKRYTGEWSSSACLTDECRGVYRDVLRIHRRHIRQGEASLTAPDGSRGPITEKIQNAFFDIVNGRNPKHAQWLTKV